MLTFGFMRANLFLVLIFLITGIALKAQTDKGNEIFVTNNDSVRLYGTLLVPQKAKKPVPLAIFISGSGPTDRNGNQGLMSNNSLKSYAEGLCTKGIASFRFDKRGVGHSIHANIKEKDMRFEHFVDDVKAVIRHFSKNENFSRIVIIGHSEGSLIGMLAAQDSKVSQFVSVSGVARTADVILSEQLAKQNLATHTKVILDSLKMGHRVKNLGRLDKLFRPSVQAYMISWFKYNPSVEIKKLTCPVLIVQGDNDIQVKVKDAQLLKEALPDAELLIIPKMNHVLKIIKGSFEDNLKSYYNSDLGVSKKLIKATASFINKMNNK